MRTTISVFVFLILLVSGRAFAKAARASKPKESAPMSFASRDDLAVKGELETIQKLNDRVKSGDRSLCATYNRTDMSGCVKMLIQGFRVHSAAGVRAMLEIPVSAALKDRELGFDDKLDSLWLADNFLTVVECVRPQIFFAKKIAAKTEPDRKAQIAALSRENRLLESFRNHALPAVEAHLIKTELMVSSNETRSVATETSITTSQLRARLAQAKARHWSII
jgi:hypothetical protein